MRRLACVTITLALAAMGPIPAATAATAVPLPSDAVVLMPGHGWGHARGMGQWGARGMAGRGRTYTQILTHYYTGVTIGTRSSSEDVRVLIENSASAIVTSDAPFAVSWSTGGVVARSDSTYRFFRARWDGSRYRLEKSPSHTGPWTFVRSGSPYFVFTRGTSLLQLVFDAGTVRWYRGSLIARRTSAGSMNVINQLAMRDYLQAVVPREMPSSWPAEALKAQAVAARTYAARQKDGARARGRTYDICATTSCQVYSGYATASRPGATRRNLEASSTNSAVSATAGRVVLYRGAPISAEYSSSTGGYSAPGTVPYQRAVPDPGDAGTPHHDWTARLTVRQIQARWPSLGRLVDIRVTDRNGFGEWGGRVDAMQLIGTSGTVTLSGHAMRSAFAWPAVSRGLQSNWFLPLVWKGEIVAAPAAFTAISGETSTFVAQVRNTGTAPWPIGGNIRLGAASSRFHGPGWISTTRPATVSRNVSGSGPVTTGQTAEFRVPVDASAVAAGTYAERFTMVNDGTTPMAPSFTVQINVLPGWAETAANLLENGSFESSLSPWRGSGLSSGDGRTTATHRLGASALRIRAGTKSVVQAVRIAGGRGRGFVLGGWNRGDATSSSGGAVELSATMRYTDGSTSTVRLPFSRAAHPWTYDERSFTSSRSADLASVTVRASVTNQRGTSYFDALRLLESPVANPSFEDGTAGWTRYGFTTGDGVTRAAAVDGLRSLALGSGATRVATQVIALSGRRTERFVLSVWDQATGDASNIGRLSATVEFVNTDGTRSIVANTLGVTGGQWRRNEFVVRAPKNFARVVVRVSSRGGSGRAYVDGVRLVRTFTVNPSFEGQLVGWTAGGFGAGDGITAINAREGARALEMTGGGRQNVVQSVALSGGPGLALVVSGWNRATATASSGGLIAMVLGFRNTDGTTSWRTVGFATAAHGWRYLEGRVVAPRRFSRVDLYAVFYDQTGSSAFDAITLRRA